MTVQQAPFTTQIYYPVGRFITFEGPEGCGKSTQLKLLHKHLIQHRPTVVWTREPGGSVDAEEIREILISGERNRWDGLEEVLLFTIARRNHLRTLVLPLLRDGTWVLSDRYRDSSIAYQCFGRGVQRAQLEWLHMNFCYGREADLTFIIDVPVAVGLGRVMQRAKLAGGDLSRFEREDNSFHNRLRNGYLTLAKENPRYMVIDGTQSIEQVHLEILNHLPKWT